MGLVNPGILNILDNLEKNFTSIFNNKFEELEEREIDKAAETMKEMKEHKEVICDKDRWIECYLEYYDNDES